jgi:hypothetical protein
MYEKFIARQPIFDEKLKIFAYELLFRAGSQNVFQLRKEASSSVIVDSIMLFAIFRLSPAPPKPSSISTSLPRGEERLVFCLPIASLLRFSKPFRLLRRSCSSAKIFAIPATLSRYDRVIVNSAAIGINLVDGIFLAAASSRRGRLKKTSVSFAAGRRIAGQRAKA